MVTNFGSERSKSWQQLRKVHSKNDDPRVMDPFLRIREEVGQPGIEKKGLPDKEFNAPTKGEAKKLLDEWKVKIAIQDAITTNIKVCDYAQKYLSANSYV